jgi:hypothetical protein
MGCQVFLCYNFYTMKRTLAVAVWLAGLTVIFTPWCEAQQRPAHIAQPSQQQNPSSTTPPVSANSASTNNYSYQSQPPSGDAAVQWVLIVVGIITAGFIGWQALETRRAAQATRDSVGYMNDQVNVAKRTTDILIASERAWISIKTDMEDFNPADAPSRFYWRAVNTGKSVARLISTDARFLIWNGYDPLPDIPQFGNTGIDLKGRILAPGEPYQFHGGYFEDWQNGAYSFHDINNRLDATPPNTLYLLMYGRIRYETMGKDCESNFVEDYTWVKNRPRPFEGFRAKLEAPATYSNHT